MNRVVLNLADRCLEDVKSLRKELHRIPELAGNEVRTSALLRERLKPLPIALENPFLHTDVVGIISGNAPGRNVTLRADMDALPLTENTRSDHVSVHPGKMHACGHDGHMAMLYGAAKILCELRSEFPGTVRILFQPGEEIAAMAKPLLDAGATDHPHMDFCAALHGWPGVKHNCISTRSGAVMAAAGFFKLTVTGKGGHGSLPKLAKNPIPILAQIVSALEQETPRDGVCTVCRIEGGNNSNIIPAQAFIEGTVRFLDDRVGECLETVFRSVTERVCSAAGASFELDYHVTYPVTKTSASGASLAEEVTAKYLGADCFVPMSQSSMSSEDFSYFLQRSDGVFAHLGLGESVSLHNPNFEFDDAVLKNGMVFLAAVALEYLCRENPS